MEIAKRKSIRLKNYDYSWNGAYFVTICTYNRECILAEIVGQGLCSCRFTNIGKIVEKEIKNLENRYKNILIPNFIIMPNHVHFIIEIDNNTRQEQSPCPTIGDVVCTLKSITTKEANLLDNTKGRKIWQYRYHDHIIRNEKEYQQIWQYIDTNTIKWQIDCYYTK